MTYIDRRRTGPWEVVIGLEVHAQVISKAKLFSGAATAFGAEPNTQVSFVDAGVPRHAAGDQPRLRRAGGAHRARPDAQINWSAGSTARTTSTPICRAGYQISQYQHPIVGTA
jgi:aspartyl-tRNA(Asn)/glutamyl-tRNA(Gln) amidotransferase subunit B